MSRSGGPLGYGLRLCGAIGRSILAPFGRGGALVGFLQHLSSIWALFLGTLRFTFIAPWTRNAKLARRVWPMLFNVGVRSFPIVALLSFLIGAILVIQTGPIMAQYGQTGAIPQMVALSVAREFGPVMTAIILTARVGASFTAVIASMKINEEVMALQTMNIDPVGYLVAPRFVGMMVMVPCLVVLADAIGMLGGGLAAYIFYDLGPLVFLQGVNRGITLMDIVGGLIKSAVFGLLICIICCYYGLITTGGSMGLGRNTMVAVVTSLVAVIIADAMLGGLFIHLLY